VTDRQLPKYVAYSEHCYWVETSIGKQHLIGKMKSINHDWGFYIKTHKVYQQHPQLEREVRDDEDDSQRHHKSCGPDP